MFLTVNKYTFETNEWSWNKGQLVESYFQFTACEICCVNELILFLSEEEKEIVSASIKEDTFLWIYILQCVLV